MKFCKYCGKEISDDAEFCRHCGKSLTGAAGAQPAQPAVQQQPVQQAAQQPVRAASHAAPAPEPAPKKKGGAGKIIIAIIIVAVLAVVGVIVWNNLHTNTPPVNSNTTSSSSATNSSSSSSTSSAAITMEKGEDGFGWVNLDSPAASKPSGAKDITDFAQARGDWKCVFIFEPTGSNDKRTRDYATLSINGAEGNFSVIIAWDYYDDGYERTDQSDSENTVLNGEWNAGKLTTTGDCTMDVTFFVAGNSSYAVGTFEAATGAKGTVAFYKE